MYHVLHGANLMSKQTELAQVADTITVDSGNVGIGTSSPTEDLTIASTSPQIRLEDTDASGTPYSKISGVLGNVYIQADDANEIADSKIDFRVDGIQRAIIDASGNLLVGKTSSNSASVGVEARANGTLFATKASSNPAGFNRTTSDGAIVNFYKDNSTVGSIGNGSSTSIYIAGNTQANSNLAFGGTSLIYPTVDNVSDLGASSLRFDDVYATNGTIQTSDANEKQDIAELSDAEQRVAVAAKGLMRKFRWRDAVEAKGDDARTHFGIIAQDLQAAFAAEGLDAGDYAMFISSTWWETQTEVPAVEAVAEVTETTTDEDGNEVVTVVTEAVEAVDAYTRTDAYDTQEEAPEGATERTRLGVRYSELLAFIIGAL
jgi:hypothetical protein